MAMKTVRCTGPSTGPQQHKSPREPLRRAKNEQPAAHLENRRAGGGPEGSNLSPSVLDFRGLERNLGRLARSRMRERVSTPAA
jgi:hypothetical protein